MRLTLEGRKRVFVFALEQIVPPEPEQINPRGDVFAATERAESFDYDDQPPVRVGFASGKRGK